MVTSSSAESNQATQPQPVPSNAGTDLELPQREGGLSCTEKFWRDHKSWLEEHGYMLRPRYHSCWVPSWKGKEISRFECEDGHLGWETDHLMDARRLSDGAIVMLKRLVHNSSQPSREAEMGRLFSSDSYTSDPHNHCVPIYETLKLPNSGGTLMVMPFLSTWFLDNPPFYTIGEMVEFCRQIFEGLQFMHSHRIAHNDIKFDNIMMDSRPLFDQPMHPVYKLRSYDWKVEARAKPRSKRPVKYYYIDFDLCRQYDSSSPAQEIPPYGGDLSVPEFKSQPSRPCDPFLVDVYRLGNVVRRKFTGGGPHGKLNPCFSFMHELISDMTQDDPSKRPTMDQVVSHFELILKRLSWVKLRSRMIRADETILERMIRAPTHWARQVAYIVTRVPAIPRA